MTGSSGVGGTNLCREVCVFDLFNTISATFDTTGRKSDYSKPLLTTSIPHRLPIVHILPLLLPRRPQRPNSRRPSMLKARRSTDIQSAALLLPKATLDLLHQATPEALFALDLNHLIICGRRHRQRSDAGIRCVVYVDERGVCRELVAQVGRGFEDHAVHGEEVAGVVGGHDEGCGDWS